ncbi:hypothetical protein EV188_101991 [Actinomycetospora succinea]|uniref:Uncharacterized protein n=1 Tax=Actinomycetospora succinea TaxID=663603 RepID=A0A4R6VPA5_9PSEU|nr:hypothetical protein [Actinomycetospora succinea]TDQ65739.1 hypothetical protein EV188_101991 [Actinomycetospora succinea]
MSSDDTPVVAVREAITALRAGTVTRELDGRDLAMLGTEARALVEQLVDVLMSVDRATTDPRDPHTRDLESLRSRLATALAPVDVAGGDPRDGVEEAPAPAHHGTADD